MDVNMKKFNLSSIKQTRSAVKKHSDTNLQNTDCSDTNYIGAKAEEIASQYLIDNKLKLIQKNYHCRQGEIDLIMQDDQELVFVEVRYRKHTHHGNALESIHRHKLQRIQTAINHYIMTNNLSYIPCRIDVVGLHGNLQQPDINWIKNIIIE